MMSPLSQCRKKNFQKSGKAIELTVIDWPGTILKNFLFLEKPKLSVSIFNQPYFRLFWLKTEPILVKNFYGFHAHTT